MAFDALLGNDRLKENLRRAIRSGHISHFYLISGPSGSGKHTLARLLAAAIVCRGGGDRPCGDCLPCRKVAENNHPDVITVADPEHKTVAVKIVRRFREDVFIRPNEADYKIYVFAQELGVEGQNTLLKILEEPPAYGVFILLAENPQQLLPTVRSRCTELSLQPLDGGLLRRALREKFPDATDQAIEAAQVRSGGFLGQALHLLQEGAQLPEHTCRFARVFGARDALGLTGLLSPMEKYKREQLIQVLCDWSELLQSALVYRNGIAAFSEEARTLGTQRSPAELMNAITAIKKAIDYAHGNISVAAICGWLSWELR